jgi:hypothetical protein
MERPLDARYVVDRPYLSKAKDWEYEREWRLLALTAPSAYAPNVPPDLLYGKKGLHDFPPELITRVILGCRMTSEDKDTVKAWIRSGPARPKVCEAHADSGAYRLEIVET